MPRTALFTGAGASQPFGFPLTREILPKIRDEINSGELFAELDDEDARRERLDRGLRSLLPGYSDTIQLPLITDVLSLVDYSLLTDSTPSPRVEQRDLVDLRFLLEAAIFDALWWPWDTDQPSPPLLRRFAEWIDTRSHDVDNAISIVSTNYDIAIEDELFDICRRRPGEAGVDDENALIAGEFDFGFAWRDPDEDRIMARPANPRISVLKLHGSLNWLRCEACDQVYLNPYGIIAGRALNRRANDWNTCHCGHAKLRMMVVAPSLVRDIRNVTLLEVWKAALEQLRRAEDWIVIGYSFPPEDIAVRSLFLRAYKARSSTPRIRIVLANLTKSERDATEARFRLFFPECTFEYGGAEAFIRDLASEGKS